MKVVVIGGAGFLGSHVSDALDKAGHKVTVYDRTKSPYTRNSQKMVVGDILDADLVNKTVKGCDVVYHFAGIADIDEASKKPLDAVKCNILGTSIILDACSKAGIKRFVYSSSLYVYSKAGSFYRTTKQACELLIENYNEVYRLPYTILRYGSLYGPRADDRNFIHNIVNQALTQNKIVREGDGEEIREYIHAYDAARISVEILSKDYLNQYVVISGNQQMKVRDLLQMIKEMLDNRITIEYKKLDKTYHYEITPYTFAPKLALKVISGAYIDLGQGVLKCIQNQYKEINPLPTYDGLIIKKEKR